MIELEKKQEDEINKLVEKGVIQDKEGFIKEAISKHLNKPGIKNQLKKINREKNDKDGTQRIGAKFIDELEDIKKERMKLKKDKKRISSGNLTNMIPRHDDWNKIKEDLIKHKFD